MFKKAANLTYQTGRRIVVAIVGATILLVGVVMIVAPGPAILLIPTGLAILGIEFLWARRWLRKLREMISRRSAEKRGQRAEGHR